MTAVEKNLEAHSEATANRDAWVKPEIVSFEAVTATQSATMNAGDGGNNNS